MVLVVCSCLYIVLAFDCRANDHGSRSNSSLAEITSIPLSIPKAYSQSAFSKIPVAHSNVTFENRIDTRHPLKRLYQGGYGCGGVAIGDIDGDSRPDLFFVSGPGHNKLYRQRDHFKFEDITASAGVAGGNAWGTGAAMADVDNDGDLDITVCNYNSPPQLFVNDGKGIFSEQAERFGLNLPEGCLMPAFSDFDLDGYLDVYFLNNRLYREGGRPANEKIIRFREGNLEIIPEMRKFYGLIKTGTDRFKVIDVGRPDKLFRHNGSHENPQYTEVTNTAGISDRGMGLSVTWWDYNSDGLPDIYVGNDFLGADNLWQNNGDGTFTESLKEAMPHTTWSSMGAAAGDVNNDGYADLLSADMAATSHYKDKIGMGEMQSFLFEQVAGPPPQMMRNALYLGTGTRRFFEAAYLAGVAVSDWTWTVKLADLDNDG